MTRSPLLSLLLAGTVALAVSGCGSDDPPATTTGASAVATTTTTPPTTTETTPGETTPTDTTRTGPRERFDYVKGGKPADEAQTAEVRGTLKAFGEALAARDAKAICGHTVGFGKVAKDAKSGASCESMFANSGSTSGPTKEEFAQIAKATVTVKGDKATADLGTGAPLPLRRVDGQWKIDYAAIVPSAAKAKKEQ